MNYNYKLLLLLMLPAVATLSFIQMTNKMQLCRTIYYSIVPWPLNMFRAILSLIIRSF